MVARKASIHKGSAPVPAVPEKPPGKTRGRVPPEKPLADSTPALAVTPEPVTPHAPRRKRLAKAFERPLDKGLKKKAALVRDRFTFPEDEYAQLVRLKKQLDTLGVKVKKSELVRAGLLLLSSRSDEELKALLAGIPAVR